MKRTKSSVDDLVDGIDLPHKRHKDWAWSMERGKPVSRDRLVFYADKLRQLGMADGDIACLISDLYWDSFSECLKNETFKKKLP